MISLWKGLSHPDTGGGWGTWGRGAAVTLVVLGNGRTQRSQRCRATPRMHSFPGRLYLVLNGIFPAGGPSLAGLRPLRNAVIKHPLWWMFPEHSSPPTPCSPGDGKPMDVHQFLSEEKRFIPGDMSSPFPPISWKHWAASGERQDRGRAVGQHLWCGIMEREGPSPVIPFHPRAGTPSARAGCPKPRPARPGTLPRLIPPSESGAALCRIPTFPEPLHQVSSREKLLHVQPLLVRLPMLPTPSHVPPHCSKQIWGFSPASFLNAAQKLFFLQPFPYLLGLSHGSAE